MEYWIYIDGLLYINKAKNFINFINDFLKEYNLLLDDLSDIIAIGYSYQNNAFIIFNNTEINEVKDWLSNFYKKVYIVGDNI